MLLAALLAGPAHTPPAGADDPVGRPPAELVDIGRSIYRDGRSPDGPLRAILVGNTAVEGPQFACVHCHRRSGLGAAEGDTGTRPVTGKLLYETRHFGYGARLAYSDETLARAIRDGIDSVDNRLQPPMPRYALSDRDMAGLIAYLKTLSAEISPGVTDSEIHFATIIAGDVPNTSERAMLDVLETYVHDKNAGTRNETRLARSGLFHRDYRNQAYRKWILHTWRLTGDPGTWPAQLASHYARQNVFAVVSGITAGDWTPVHTFCEQQEIPCLLPNTDIVPLASADDFYTIYFSPGVALEADAIAADLGRRGDTTKVLQVFRPGVLTDSAAEALHRAAANITIEDWALGPGEHLDAAGLAARDPGADVAVLWVDGDTLAELKTLPGNTTAYLSATLLGDDVGAVPEGLRGRALVADPYTLPAERATRFQRVETWLKGRNLALTEPRIRAQTYFACLIAAEGLMHIRTFFYRDYLLDSLDHAEGIARFSAYYPRLSFGPGQRHLAKGSYIVRLADGPDVPLVRDATWVVP